MFKGLLTGPLQQALLLLWGLGVVNIILFPVKEGSLSWAWIVSTLCANLLTLLLAARLRKPLLTALAIILGLGSVLASFYKFDISTLSVLGIVAAAYTLVVWLTATRMLAHPFSKKILAVFKLSGGYGEKGGLQAVETVVHWCCFGIAIAAILAGVINDWQQGQIPSAPLLIVAAAMLFLLMSGKRYHLHLHSYLFIGLGVWAEVTIFTLFGLGAPFSGTGLSVTDAWQGLIVALLGLVFLLTGGWLFRPLHEEENAQELLQKHLYIRPLLVSAVVCALMAAVQGIALPLTGELWGSSWVTLASCAIAGFVLIAASHVLRCFALTFSGLSLISLTLIWFYSAVVHNHFPLRFYFSGIAIADQCLLVSILGLILAFLARYSATSRWQRIYERPFFILAIVYYALSCLGVLAVYMDETSRMPFLPLILFILTCTLFPLPYRSSHNSGDIRGIGLACLLSLLTISMLESIRLQQLGIAFFFCGWAYVMWAISNIFLPRLNSRFPQWTVSVNSWPWLGLLALGLGMYLAPQPVLLQWNFTLIMAGFFFLMMRNSFSPIFKWLTVLSLTWSGLIFSGARYFHNGLEISTADAPLLAMENLLWINILLLTVPWFRVRGVALLQKLHWRQPELANSIQVCTLGVCCLWLVALATREAQAILFNPGTSILTTSDLLLGGVLSLSFLHGLWWSRCSKLVHPLLAALFCTLLAGWTLTHPFQFPVFLALWSSLLLGIGWQLNRNDSIAPLQALSHSLLQWLHCSLFINLAAVCLPDISTSERLISLALWSVTVSLLGCRTQSRIWLAGAAVMFIVLVHGIWFIPMGFDRFHLLLPWFSCELIIIAWALEWLFTKMDQEVEETTTAQGVPWHLIREILTLASSVIILLALLEWVAHFYCVVRNLLAGGDPQWLFGYADPLIALLAIGLVALRVLQLARDRQTPVWIYGMSLLITFAAVYIRILLIGLTPLCLWDTAVVMAAAYGLFILQHFISSRPLLNMILFLPLLSLVTVFFQQDSVKSSVTLLITGMLYILIQRRTEKAIFLNLGILAFNGAIYLWVPDLAKHFDLLQIYLIPAALTVLLLLHLHRHEIKENVQNGSRLAALSILYSVVTLDVFLVDNLMVFALALLLSLSGVVVGIALRTRAFFYTGTAFLVLNVFGQLLQLYPEQRLGRALILMGLGAVITGSMIWFNIKRELILRKIRIYRADLETWE